MHSENIWFSWYKITWEWKGMPRWLIIHVCAGCNYNPPIISRLYNGEKKIVFAEGGEIAKVVMNDGPANVEDGNRSQRSN